MSCPTKYRVIKDGWGNRPNFQHSYGLKMTPDDIDEGTVILDQLVRNAVEEWEEEQRRNGAYDTEEDDHDAASSQAGPDYSPSSASYGQDPGPFYYGEPAVDTQYSAAGNSSQYYEDPGSQYHEDNTSGTQYEYQQDTPQYEAEEVYDGQAYEYSANTYGESSCEDTSYNVGDDRDDGADYYDGGYGDDSGSYDDDGGYASAGSYGGDDYDDYSDY